MIEVKGLTKFYGSKKAVDNLNFTIDSGEIVGFLGRHHLWIGGRKRRRKEYDNEHADRLSVGY